MNINTFIQAMPLIALGLAAGVMGGMFGIGGGLVMVPGLILLFGLDQKVAFGTSLFAQLLPVGLLGVFEYWQRGEIKVGHGLLVALGLFVGAWLGGWLVGLVPREPMKQAYGVFLLAIGIYFVFIPGTPKRDVRDDAASAISAPGRHEQQGR